MAQHSRKPYKLPEMLRCEEEKILQDDEREREYAPVIDLINEYITKHEQHLRRYEYLESLYKGFHDIFLWPEKPEWKPDHRLAVNFPRYMTETFCGYGYGIPIKVTYPGDDESAERTNEIIQDFGKGNEIDDHNSEMAKLACIYGHSWEYLYQNEDSETKITACTPVELFCVYDDTVKGRALFAIRYWYKVNSFGIPEGRVGEMFTRQYIYRFSEGKITERDDNPYGYIPVVEWRLNDERIGLYEMVAGLIEAYNAAIGEKANDIEAFAEAYMAIFGAPLSEDQVKEIRDNRVINVYDNDGAANVHAEFLARPAADSSQEHLLDRLEDLIYETSMVANISDESFGNSTSGVALQYKLQAMSNLAQTFDRKIEKSLKKRYKIFCALQANGVDEDAYRDLEITFTRNIPANQSEEIEAAKSLAGIVSQETQLSRLSFIRDVKAEIDKMNEETLSRMSDLGFGDMNGGLES